LAYFPRGEAVRPGSRITVSPAESPVISAMLYAFAPLHKRAFGIATGVAGAVVMVWLTIAGMYMPNAGDFPLELLGQYFLGYTVTCCLVRGWLVRGILPESRACHQCLPDSYARRARVDA
jgi:hypothetical protein